MSIPQQQKTVPTPSAPSLTQLEAQAAARAVVNLFRLWNVTDIEARDLLGGLPRHTWSRWKARDIGPIRRDLGTRLSLYLGIHSALRLIFGNDRDRLYGRMRRGNSAFGGASVLEVICNGQMLDLWRVRQFLHGACVTHREI
ncbi:antitoxin Xre-like helix-turn-helix domain-containing protein [Ruixingdingia sedimenti]|uniref:Antitoxin Xre-like helix-turn-helix domain-containing protein n=1 Tax=Ruixingdingia sedimenti TaxID=3073604 RepID=A0ABU1FDV2_9RHOB|nr:antitoxin Xre-like helix-turn-helix domain-containing protein [Xinfangfangia sp. LG-4]MDR5654733.1 hypothetical protein [Xinfangfangia sp. LG-4]